MVQEAYTPQGGKIGAVAQLAERGTPNPAVGGSSPPCPAWKKAMGKIRDFLNGVRSELRRVAWPDRKLITKATISVIIFSLVVGVYLWVLDLAFTKLLSLIFALRGA